ncbi:hypothetical protein V8C42DRAFT_360082 [Trichoderma barbatum]
MEPAPVQRFKYACTECQRRKQKCNRIYPCSHCKVRSAQRQCHFKERASKTASGRSQANGVAASGTAVGKGAKGKAAGRKRSRDSSDDSSCDSDSEFDSDSDVDNGNPDPGVQNGTAAGSDGSDHPLNAQVNTLFTPLTSGAKTKQARPRHSNQYHISAASCPELRNALNTLPQKREHKNLEKMLGASCQERTESFHYSARYLYSSMPVGRYHRNNVLWLLHSTYWYKAEALFIECCHVFNTAVREAQELGFNTEQDVRGVPNFELEMRRRAWCVIDSWDWQIASGLSRPTLVDHSTCRAQRPSLTLELDGEFSPLMHMNMQSDLIHKLARRFTSPSLVGTRSDVLEYKGMIDEWMHDFPPIFALVNPDTSNDKKQAWIEYHRHYNYTMGYMMVLNPFRQYMSLPYTDKSTAEELELRRIAVDLSLLIVKVLDDWLKFLTFRDGRFHFIIFSLVDASTVMSNMVLNDQAGTLPRRDDIYRSIKTALVLQRKLYFLSDSAKVGFRVIQRIVRHLFRQTSPEYLASLEEDCDLGDDAAQSVQPAASERPNGNALMRVHSIDPENPMGSGLWDQSATEVPTKASGAETELQSAPDRAPVASIYTNGATVSCECMECEKPSTRSEYQANTPSQDTSASAATFDYSETAVSSNLGTTTLEYISPLPFLHVSPASPSHIPITTQVLLAAAPMYVESAPPEHISAASSDYTSFTSPAFVAALSSDDATPASLNYIAATFPCVEPGFVDDASSASPGCAVNTSLSNARDYTASYDVGASPDSTAAMPIYVNPARLVANNPFTASEYVANTSSINTEPITGSISPFIPMFIPDNTIYDTTTPCRPWTGCNEAGLHTISEFYDSSAVYDTIVTFNAPSAYATSASYTSPESDNYTNPPTEYDTPSPCVVPTTYATSTLYTFPEYYTSPESHGASGEYASSTAGASVLPATGEDDSVHTASTSYETPESYYTAPAYTALLNNSASPDEEPLI